MKCLYCDKEMIYKPNMRGYGSRGENYNELVIDYSVEKDYVICKRKINKIFSFMPQYYVCPKCGLVLQKIPDKYIDDVINAEW